MAVPSPPRTPRTPPGSGSSPLDLLLKTPGNRPSNGLVIATLLFSMFLLCLLVYLPEEPVDFDSSFSNTDELDEVTPRKIFQAWTQHYGLDRLTPPESSPAYEVDPDVLPAPHVQDCVRLTKERRELEMYDSEGNPPAWTRPSFSDGIKVPWVEGADEENLPLTHVVQRDYWLHQHPRNCKDKNVRFLLTPWAGSYYHGLGSQLHVMSVLLTVAHALGRILVPMPNSFYRSQHDGCLGKDNGSLSCYFFPLTREDCAEEAVRLWKENDINNKKIFINAWDLQFPQLLNISNERGRLIVIEDPMFVKPEEFRFFEEATAKWGRPWVHISKFIESSVTNATRSPDHERLLWLRSQTIRYMLRWPSLSLCHLVNRERHLVYGEQVAYGVAEAMKFQKLRQSSSSDLNELAGFEGLAHKPGVLQSGVWSNQTPFIFRPIVSMHVRQSDKAVEMELIPLSTYMFILERLRFRSPDLKYVWLITETQNVISELGNYTDWTFLHSHETRTNSSLWFYFYEKQTGIRQIVEASFVNLIISSECDYFLGTLGSNWSRLINELRLTNGRLVSGYICLNYIEW